MKPLLSMKSSEPINNYGLIYTPSCEGLLRNYGLAIRQSSLPSDLLQWIQSRTAPLNKSGEVRQPLEPLAIPGPSGTLFIRYCECSSVFILLISQ